MLKKIIITCVLSVLSVTAYATISYKYVNNAKSELAAEITLASTTVRVKTGDGSKFPQNGQFRAVVYSRSCLNVADCSNREYFVLQLSSSNTFSIISRASQSTDSPASWPIKSRIEQAWTAADINDIIDELDSLTTLTWGAVSSKPTYSCPSGQYVSQINLSTGVVTCATDSTGSGISSWEEITDKPAAVTALTGTNTGDQDLSSYSLTTHNHSGFYEPIKGADDNYVTDSEKVVITQTSGTNTGDQDLSGYSLTTHNHDADYKDIAYAPSLSEIISALTYTPAESTHNHDADYKDIAYAPSLSEIISALTYTPATSTHNHTGVYEPLKGADDNYVTDAEKVVITQTSGTNTGDETLASIVSKMGYTPIASDPTTTACTYGKNSTGVEACYTALSQQLETKSSLTATCDAGVLYRYTGGASGQQLALCEASGTLVVQGDGEGSGSYAITTALSTANTVTYVTGDFDGAHPKVLRGLIYAIIPTGAANIKGDFYLQSAATNTQYIIPGSASDVVRCNGTALTAGHRAAYTSNVPVIAIGVATNDWNLSSSVACTDGGIADITSNPTTTLDLGSAITSTTTGTVVLTNDGAASSVTLTTSLTGTNIYEIASNTCTTQVSSGASCTLGIQLSPPDSGVTATAQLAWTWEQGQSGSIITTGTGSSGGGGYADILFYWGCESTTIEKTAGDSTPTAVGSAAIDGAVYQVGAASCDLPGSYASYSFTLNNDDIVDTTSGRVGFYLYCDTLTSNYGLFRAFYDASNVITMHVYDADETYTGYVAGGTGATYQRATGLAATTWQFIEFRWNKGGSGNDYEVYVNGVSQDAYDDASGTWAMSANGILNIGDFDGQAGDCHVDQFIVSNDPTRDLYAIRNNTSFPD